MNRGIIWGYRLISCLTPRSPHPLTRRAGNVFVLLPTDFGATEEGNQKVMAAARSCPGGDDRTRRSGAVLGLLQETSGSGMNSGARRQTPPRGWPPAIPASSSQSRRSSGPSRTTTGSTNELLSPLPSDLRCHTRPGQPPPARDSGPRFTPGSRFAVHGSPVHFSGKRGPMRPLGTVSQSLAALRCGKAFLAAIISALEFSNPGSCTFR